MHKQEGDEVDEELEKFRRFQSLSATTSTDPPGVLECEDCEPVGGSADPEISSQVLKR